ncbi:MAG: hypothetical protein QM750_20090 [Rubrivivax sp.]
MTLEQFLAGAVISACVSALSLGLYDATVRVPRTPRLAVVDVAKLFTAAERQFKAQVLAPAATAAAGATAPAGELATLGKLGEFGPRIERVMHEVAMECGCVLVAMAAVVGDNPAVPDYTRLIGARLGLSMRDGGRAAP